MTLKKIYWLAALCPLSLLLLMARYEPGCSCADFLGPEYDFRFQVSNRADDAIEPFLFNESLGYLAPGEILLKQKTYSATEYPTVADYYVIVSISARNLRTGKLTKSHRIKLTWRETPVIEFRNSDFIFLKLNNNGAHDIINSR